MGAFCHLAVIACVLRLPYPRNTTAVEATAAPVMAVFPVVTVLLCLMLAKRQAFWKTRGRTQQRQGLKKPRDERHKAKIRCYNAKPCGVCRRALLLSSARSARARFTAP